MNKKQLVTAWVMGILSAILLFRLFTRHNDLYLLTGLPSRSPTVLSFLSLVLIIGGLLIYTLRDKTKNILHSVMKIKLLTLVILVVFAISLFKIQTHYNIQKEKQKLADIEYDNSLKMLIADADRAKQKQYEEEQRRYEEAQLKIQEEQLRLQKAMIALQVFNSMPQTQYQPTYRYQRRERPKSYNVNIQPTIVGPGYSNQSYQGTIQEQR